MHRFNFARLAIATAGVLLLATRVAVDLYRGYVNYFRWTLDYPLSKYAIATATIALIVFGRFPVWLAGTFLLVAGYLQVSAIADSWAHVGRIAHGDDYGVLFVELGEFYFLVALVVFTFIFHLVAAAARSADSPHPEA